MKYCNHCKKKKPLIDFAFYTKYPSTLRSICRECERKRSRFYSKRLQEDLSKNEEKAIEEFNTLKYANRILNLLESGFDVSWDGESVITFASGEKRVHAKHATKEMYTIIFARYCIELKKRENANY